MARRLVILGSTGSIGTQALDVVERSAGELELVGISAAGDWQQLLRRPRSSGSSGSRWPTAMRPRARRRFGRAVRCSPALTVWSSW